MNLLHKASEKEVFSIQQHMLLDPSSPHFYTFSVNAFSQVVVSLLSFRGVHRETDQITFQYFVV
jgi:hypothetical protein